MLLKNNCKRLLILSEPLDKIVDVKTGSVISATGGASYNLLPAGDAVSVPDSLCETRFVKALIQLGDIIISEDEGDDGEGDEFDLSEKTKAELVDFAEENKIEINPSSKKADILLAITEAVGD